MSMVPWAVKSQGQIFLKVREKSVKFVSCQENLEF